MIFAEIGKFVGGKVLTAIIFLAVAAAGYWFYTHPEQLEQIWLVMRGVLLWLGLTLVLPWALFFVTGKVVAADSNAAGAALLVGLTAVDALFAFFLMDWSVSGTLTWMVLLLGFLCAGVYNFLVCDYQAERFSDAV